MKKSYKIIIRVLSALMIIVGLVDIKALWWEIVLGILIGAVTFKKPKPKAEPRPASTTRDYDFHVQGTKYEQCQGMTGQQILATMPLAEMRSEGSKPYGDFTKKECEELGIDGIDIYKGRVFMADIEETEFDGKYAVKVFYKNDQDSYQIGWIAERDLQLFKDIYNKRMSMWLEIDGGKTKYLDGEIEKSDYEAILYIRVK